jgi:hypothetical protein
VIGIVRRTGFPTLLNVGGSSELAADGNDGYFVAEALLGEAEVRCGEERASIEIGDEVWWDDEWVYWTMTLSRAPDGDVVCGDVRLPRRA